MCVFVCVCPGDFAGFGVMSVQQVDLWCLCVFGRVWSGFGGVSVQQVGFWCVLEILWGLGELVCSRWFCGVCVCMCVCVCGRVWGFWVCEFAAGSFVVLCVLEILWILRELVWVRWVCCVCVCLGDFGAGLGSECAAGGFVVCVCVCMCVCVCVCVGEFGADLVE